MICDLSGIVNEGFTIPENSVHKTKNIFLCENVFGRVIQVELLVFDH